MNFDNYQMNKKKLKHLVRIVGGQWRGRKISFPENSQVRPTPDRVKETLFNWLAPYIVGARCLELFAGSASLSFESLSRQAAYVVAVEKDRDTVEAIQSNATTLKAENLKIVLADCLSWLKTTQPPEPFNIIFIDPPYAIKALPESFALVNTPDWVAPGTLIYFESDITFAKTDLPNNWELLKNKKAGQVLYHLVKVLSHPV